MAIVGTMRPIGVAVNDSIAVLANSFIFCLFETARGINQSLFHLAISTIPIAISI
jgi:hypothetical protein